MAQPDHYAKQKLENADYIELRKTARDIVEKTYIVSTGAAFRLTDIDSNAFAQAAAWRLTYEQTGKVDRMPGWSWQVQYFKLRYTARRVELAIWSGETLCGLTLGEISRGRLHAKILFLEGSPLFHPLKGEVAPIATRFLYLLAALAGCSEAVIDSPFPELIEYYKRLGFTTEQKRGKSIVALKQKVVILDPSAVKVV